MNLGPWIDLEAPAFEGPESLPDRCDVAVIGGGLAGCAAAAFLAEAGASVVLLEALPGPGLRHSGRHLGMVETGLVEHPHRTVMALGDERAGQLFAMAQRNLDLLEARELLQRTGGIWAALDNREPDEIDLSAKALARLGYEAEVLAADEVDRKTGGFNFGPALFRPTDGWVDPVEAVDTFALAAEAAGATLIGSATARVAGDVDEGVLIEIEGARSLVCDAVVVAAGWASGLVEPSLEGKITPIREQGLKTAPVMAWYPTPGRAGHGYTTWRQLPDGPLLVSGCRWATPHLEVGESDDTAIVDRIQQRLEAFLRFHFPAAEETPIEDRWSWVFGQAKDGLPFVGPLPGSPQRVACCGFGGNGASFAVAAAREVADGLLTGKPGTPSFLQPVRMVKWRAGG